MRTRQYTGVVRFGPWYPLADAGDHTPPAENVVQVRLASGLLDYPRGKSAMVWYAYAPDVRAAALALSARHIGVDLVCRHLIEIDDATDLGTFCAKLREDFVRRFGTRPRYEIAVE
jgi:hypothetical protein